MRHRHSEKLRFIGQWLKNPRQTAAVAPSSPELAAAMLGELPGNAHRVIELGGGTGAITRAAPLPQHHFKSVAPPPSGSTISNAADTNIPVSGHTAGAGQVAPTPLDEWVTGHPGIGITIRSSGPRKHTGGTGADLLL